MAMINYCIFVFLYFSVNSCETNSLAGVVCTRATPIRQCVKKCGTGFFFNPKTSECQTCTVNCTTCVGSADKCTSCSSALALYGSTCVKSCPDGYYIHLPTLTCKGCSVMCKTCYDGVENDRCSSCNKPYFLRKFAVWEFLRLRL